MKKISIIIASLLLVFSFSLNAQAPYKHSVGATFGSTDGFSYKTFLMDNFALDIDLGYHWTYFGGVCHSFEVNPNFEYEASAHAGGLYWFVGGGLSLGYGYPGAGKFGINAIGGIEYKFNIPLTLQFDLRPGFGTVFNKYGAGGYFDWGICLGVRYTIH